MRLLVILLLICVPCFGQTSGTLQVVVQDPSGALVHRAHVQLIQNGKIKSTAETNQRGEARFSKLSFGIYQVRVDAAGFKSQDITDLNLSTSFQRKEVSLEIDVIKVDVEVAEDARIEERDVQSRDDQEGRLHPERHVEDVLIGRSADEADARRGVERETADAERNQPMQCGQRDAPRKPHQTEVEYADGTDEE